MVVSCAAPRRAAALRVRRRRRSGPAGTNRLEACRPDPAHAAARSSRSLQHARVVLQSLPAPNGPRPVRRRQPWHYSDPGLPGRLRTQRRAGAVWRLGPGPSLADGGPSRHIPRRTQPQGRALSCAAPRALQAPRSAHRPPAQLSARFPSARMPVLGLRPVVSPQFPPACSGNVPPRS